jgi:hypothetical protein
MENLQQIVVQETTTSYKRALAQYGTGFMPENQVEVTYDELGPSDKAIYDAFIEMIKAKK